MERTDLLDGFPVPPPERPLPGHARRREELLGAVRATERGDRRPARRQWLVPLAAAAAVLAIVIPLSLAGSHLLQSSPASGPSAGGPGSTQAHPGGSGPLRASLGPASFSRGQWHRTETVTAGGSLSSLTVSAGTGDITITGTSDSTVSVTEQMFYPGTPPRLANHQAGGHLSLGYSCGSDDCGVAYTITVPRGLAITARTGTGAIKLSGLDGQLRASTGTGTVNGTGLSSASTDLSAQTGNISVSFATAPRYLRASAGTGNVDVQVPTSSPYAVTATSGTGMVQVTVPRSASSAHVIRAHVGTGLVRVTGS